MASPPTPTAGALQPPPSCSRAAPASAAGPASSRLPLLHRIAGSPPPLPPAAASEQLRRSHAPSLSCRLAFLNRPRPWPSSPCPNLHEAASANFFWARRCLDPPPSVTIDAPPRPSSASAPSKELRVAAPTCPLIVALLVPDPEFAFLPDSARGPHVGMASA
nr:proline-rich receptor-like protein kinase PERK9 [Aegilops tauschii subsp. strangulata]